MNLQQLIPWRKKGEVRGREELGPNTYSIARLRHDMDCLFDRFFEDPWKFSMPTPWGNGDEGFLAPALDVTQTADAVMVRAEIPGIDPKDLEVTVNGDVLTIAGQKNESKEHKEGTVSQTECWFGEFRRSVYLPAEVDAEKISANYKDGVLTVQLAKTERSTAKKIPVNAN